MSQRCAERQQKRGKLLQPAARKTDCVFTSGTDICRALRSEGTDGLDKALPALRSRLSLRPDEIISPQDERLQLLKSWSETSPGFQDVFDAWERITQLSTTAVLLNTISLTLSLLSTHLPYHSYALPIIQTVLSVRWIRRLNSYLSGSHNETIFATLTLFNTISAFAGGRERKVVCEAFPWDNKVALPKLLHMRRRNKSSDSIATLSRPDIRTLYILFILSFIDKETPSPVKTAFLEQHRDAITSIFKGLNQDSYPVIERVLQVCWEGLWLDQRVKRTLKIGIFGESTIAHLIKLYDRSVPEKEGGLYIPADVVHHFLLAICSRPGQGICFKDRGWYPRETDETVALDEEERTQRKGGGKLYNKILANVLPTLKVNEDPRQQELALKIFLACPELVAGYWSTAALTFEPRLSSKWIANIAFAGQVLSQAVPSSSFLMLGTTEHNPTPPPLSVILSNVLPAVGTKAYFTKGLQAGVAGLVQHCTALTLVKCLRKLGEVVHAFKMVSVALEEDEDEGQWCRRRKEVEREARRRVPEFQVIVAFSQQYLSSSNTQNTTKHALLSESSQRLLWLYQEYLPDVVAEARFEVGKLVLTFVDGSLLPLSEDATGDPSLQCSPLQNVKQLHVLRLLNASEQFTWTGKIASSPRTYFQVLLTTLCNTSVCALQTTLSTLLRRVLTESVLFQEDPDEVDLWLASLPSGSLRRGSGTETPDGALLTDEVNSVVTFLDDCTQRCLKTPYRYMEAMSDLLQPNDAQSSDAVLTNSGVGMFASPLLMAVVEQTLAKVNGRLLTPSDALSVFTFFRRLVVKLATKQEDIGYHALRIITQKLEEPVMGEDFFADYPSIRNAIQRELSIAEASLDHFGSNSPPHRPEDDDTVGAFLNNIEKVPVPESEKARMASAFELVDWLRLADVTPTSSDISRLVAVIRRFHQPTLKVLAYFLHPAEGQLWDLSVLNALDNLIDFDWLFIHCSEVQLADELLRDRLVRALLSRQVVPSAVGGAMRLVLHGVTISKNQPYLTKDLLLLLSDLLRGAMENLGREDMEKIKAIVLTQSSFYELCLSNNLSPEIHEAMHKVIQVAFDPANAADNRLLTPIIGYWSNALQKMLSSGHYELRFAQPWIKFMESSDLLTAVNLIDSSHQDEVIHAVLEEILYTLSQKRAVNYVGPVETLPIARLLQLQAHLPLSSILEDMIATSLTSQIPFCHDGIPPFLLPCATMPALRLPRSGCLTSIAPDLISRFLHREAWSASTAKIVMTLLYLQESTPHIFVTWLNSSKWRFLSIDHVAMIFAGFLDRSQSNPDELIQLNENVMESILDQLFSKWPGYGSSRLWRLQCICRILQLGAVRWPHLTTIAYQSIQGSPIESFSFEIMYIAYHIMSITGCESLVAGLVDRALQWAVRHFSHENAATADSHNTLEMLKNVSTDNLKLKPHLIEPLLAVIIRNRLHDPAAVELAISLVRSAKPKPAVVNRLLQSVLQHVDFFKLLGINTSTTQRNEITRLVDVLFRCYPSNTCHASHIEPVIQVYRGTMSCADRRLLWSPTLGASMTNIMEVVQNLDPVTMLRSCLFFPAWRRLGEEKASREGPNDEHMYDPLLVIALSAQMLVECPPTTALGWVKVFRTNVVSLLIRCLSSKDPNIRETAACQLVMIWEGIQKSNMQEKSQVLYVLGLIKNVMHPTANNIPKRLPTYTTLVVLHALRGIFYPSNFIYPRTARFLLQRPELDVGDVPMLFSMLYSNSDDWKKERGWIIKMLADGMVSSEDWRVLKRRHTWDLLASLFQSSPKDIALRSGILEVLANLTCNAQACTSLILKSALLSWIEMQLTSGPGDHTIAWLRILENTVVVTDAAKLERTTGGEWFATICRCVTHMLQMPGDKDLAVISQTASLLLRLCLISTALKNHLVSVLGNTVIHLKRLEPRVEFPADFRPTKELGFLPGVSEPPHYAQNLHVTPTNIDQFQSWGRVVEALWRVSMMLDHRTPVWDMLTSRLLIWRSIVGEEGSPIGEWARKETVRVLPSYP